MSTPLLNMDTICQQPNVQPFYSVTHKYWTCSSLMMDGSRHRHYHTQHKKYDPLYDLYTRVMFSFRNTETLEIKKNISP